MRLQQYLAQCGVASRRKSEEIITQGRVRVNGRPVKLGDSVDPKHDIVSIDGQRIERQKELRYIMLYKPRGFVTTLTDEQGRRCITDLIRDIPQRVYPVGRLDRNSEGLLLLTNDGDFANAMMHPRNHIAKVYRVTVQPQVTTLQQAKFEEGILLDGRRTAPAQMSVLEEKDGRSIVEIVLYEGRNRQIRRMLEALQLEAMRLKRKAIGSVKLGMLQPGQWRDLTPQEVRSLQREAAEGTKTKRR